MEDREQPQDNPCQCKCMSREEFVQFMEIQTNEMEKHKWIESEKVGHDLGNQAVMDWVRKYAKQFREEYTATH